MLGGLVVLLLATGSAATIGVQGERVAIETGKRVTAKVWWNSIGAADYYLLYRRKGNEDWQSIGTFEYSDDEPVKVLNAYPSESGCNGKDPTTDTWKVTKVDLTFGDGTKKKMEKSAALKVWMEGGKVGSKSFTNYGKNQLTDGQSILVDIIAIDDLNDQPEKIWKYDIIFFGTWDGNGARTRYYQTCNIPDDNLVKELEKYLKKGYSIIAGHDTMSRFTGTSQGLGKIRDYFGIKVGGRWNEDNDSDLDADGKMMSMRKKDASDSGEVNNNNWKFTSKTVDIVKYGQVIDYPWNLNGRQLTVPVTHTYGNLATADVWMRLVYDSEEADGNNHCGETKKVGKFDNSVWECPYALEPHWDPFYYLTTKNNTAMIQTGHSNCDATEDETKILANLIYSLKQRTNKTERFDHSCVDEDVPSEPECSCVKTSGSDYEFSCSAEDPVTEYQYLVEAYDDDALTAEGRPTMIGQSDILTLNTASGFSHFAYKISTSSSTTSQSTLLKSGTQLSLGASATGTLGSKTYIDIVSVDAVGNASPVKRFKLNDVCTSIPPPTKTPTPVATPSEIPVATKSPTPVATKSPTPMATPTQSAMETPTQSAMATPTQSAMATPSQSPMATPSKSPTPSNKFTANHRAKETYLAHNVHLFGLLLASQL